MTRNASVFFPYFALVLMVLAIAGCTTARVPPPQVEFETAKVVVSTGCVADKPSEVVPLNQQVTLDQWNSLAPGAKGQAVKAQAGERLNYEASLRASTSGCTGRR